MAGRNGTKTSEGGLMILREGLIEVGLLLLLLPPPPPPPTRISTGRRRRRRRRPFGNPYTQPPLFSNGSSSRGDNRGESPTAVSCTPLILLMVVVGKDDEGCGGTCLFHGVMTVGACL